MPFSLSRWLRSSHARFIGLILLLEIIFGGALLLSITQLVRSNLDQADRATAIDMRDALLAIGRGEGAGALASAVAEQARDENDAVILLLGANGRIVAGNLSGWPPNIPFRTDGIRARLYRVGDTQPGPFIITSAPTVDGGHMLVGESTDDSDQIRSTIGGALLTALLTALPLAAVAAWLVVHIIDRRIVHIAETAAQVGAGRIDHRVALDGSGDSFDMLGGAINDMLDRIVGLLAELRTVTDSIAHDLRSPLTRLRARIDRAMLTEDPAALREAVDGISREADALLAMLATALEVSRMEAGIGREHLMPTDLALLLADIGELYEPLCEEQGRALRIAALGPAVAPVHRELLGQALSNLIDNALKYGEGAITLHLEEAQAEWRVGVADSGPGIPEDREADALRRFGRLDPARGTAGAGLGLSLVAAVAGIHDGTLRFARSEGQFTVEMSIAKSA